MLHQSFTTWQCGAHEISLSRPRIMGIVNVTPDSFSDGGKHADPDAAIAYAFELLDAGADIIDVGGESTRPGFTPVSSEEEARRVVPVVRALAEAGAIVSIDTRHPDVAKMCVRLGASIINDVTGFTNPEMVKVAAQTGAGLIIMHAGEVSNRPARKSVTLDSIAEMKAKAAQKAQHNNDKLADADQKTTESLDEVMRRSAAKGITGSTVMLGSSRRFTLPEEAPIMRQIMGFLGDRARELMRAGISRERICIDPGAGFGKLADEDVVIQRATAKMSSMGYPVMCAVSRKRFVGAVSGITDATQRDSATIGVCLGAVANGARILRVHDVASTAQALNAFWAATHSDPRRCFVGMGSNVGNCMAYLEQACRLMNDLPLTCITQVSHAYETEPALGIANPVLDCVAELKTELAPLVLIDELQKIEQQLGRKRMPGHPHSEPRTIDLDLLWIEGEVHAGHKLTLPHSGIGEREFVIEPMRDLMHDPERFLSHEGIAVKEQKFRVGRVVSDLGPVLWEENNHE